MIESIAMWGGFAGIIVALFAIIILYLTRKNILDILEKDVILFDKNFELKKQAISKALELTDEISLRGKVSASNAEFSKQAKQCYNDLLCVLSDVRVADEFYSIAIDTTVEINDTRIAQFKLMCRNDIGLKTKKAKTVKRTIENKPNITTNSFEKPVNKIEIQPTTNVSFSSEQPISHSSYEQPTSRPEQNFVRPTPVQPMNTQFRPQESRPVNSAPAQRPIARPTQTATSPAQTPIKRVGRPRKED